MKVDYASFTHEEQSRLSAAGFRVMVDDEYYQEDDDGICRQAMVWLKRHGEIRCEYDEAADEMRWVEEPSVPKGVDAYTMPDGECYWMPLYEDAGLCEEGPEEVWVAIPDPLAEAEQRATDGEEQRTTEDGGSA